MTAQQIIDKFRPYVHAKGWQGNLFVESKEHETRNAILCSIVYVEGRLDELEWGGNHVASYESLDNFNRRKNELTALLNELKAMV